MKISIIIPVLNEEKTIRPCLSGLQHLRPDCEIIVADGGSCDNTLARIGDFADKVVYSEKGRARQMNNGAEHATGDILIFLHVDTLLPVNAIQLILQSVDDSKYWGRFDIELSGNHFMFNIIAKMMSWRSAITGIATGDQAIFVTRQTFNEAGRFPEISLMEDIAISKALKKISPPVILKAKAVSSGRRWEANGVYKTIVLMWTLRLLYFFGADADFLAHRYSRGSIWKH